MALCVAPHSHAWLVHVRRADARRSHAAKRSASRLCCTRRQGRPTTGRLPGNAVPEPAVPPIQSPLVGHAGPSAIWRDCTYLTRIHAAYSYNQVHEQDDVLNMWSPDAYKVPGPLALRHFLAAVGVISLFSLLVYKTSFQPPMMRKTFPRDGLAAELGGPQAAVREHTICVNTLDGVS